MNTPHHKFRSKEGFSLLEIVVVIGIMSVLTTVTVSALPIARSNQRLKNDIQQLRTLFSIVQQQALNEVRDQACLDQVGEDRQLQIRCSTVGVALDDYSATVFADLDGNWLFTPETDYVISQHALESQISAEKQTIVFQAVPPSLYMVADGDPIAPSGSVLITLISGNDSRDVEVRPFGIVTMPEE